MSDIVCRNFSLMNESCSLYNCCVTFQFVFVVGPAVITAMEEINNFKTPNKLSEKKKSGKINIKPFFIVIAIRNVLVLL